MQVISKGLFKVWVQRGIRKFQVISDGLSKVLVQRVGYGYFWLLVKAEYQVLRCGHNPDIIGQIQVWSEY